MSPENRASWQGFASDHQLVAVWSPTPAEWASLTQPALLIEGDGTVGWLREITAKVAELLPNGELTTLRGLDHGAPWQAPDVVAQRAMEFIERHRDV
jgi:pimeloyl-ACP methyl ester carboxylesterase